MNRPHARKGCDPAFTLIELLVVVSILVLLIGILLPSLKGAKRDANRVACSSNLRCIGQAMRMYFNDNADIIPIVQRLPSLPLDFEKDRPTIAQTLTPYLEGSASARPPEESVFHCPADVPGAFPRESPNTGKSFFQTEGSSYEFRTTLYWLMIENRDADFGQWVLKPMTPYQVVRHEIMLRQYDGQLAEEALWLLKDYTGFHKSQGPNKAINYLYVDGHVSDLER